MLCLFYYTYVFSSPKLKIRAEQVLPGSKGIGVDGGGGGQGEEVAQRMYALMNK
jgi:hypothetical protein